LGIGRGKGRTWRGKEGWEGEGVEGEERVGKWKGRLDLDICPGAPEFLVTPLPGICSN